MNSSELSAVLPAVYNYLGFRGIGKTEETDRLIADCIEKLETKIQFNYLYKFYDSPPPFLDKEPYRSFLSGSRGVILSATTLGAGVDRYISRLFRVDMTEAAVTDACASALLERMADDYEKTIAPDLSYRFCPGYGGSSVDDLRPLFEELKPEKIGIYLGETCFMLPAKSMAGVIAVGKSAKKSCRGCFMAGSCEYLKEGRKCYVSEKKQ